MANIEAKASVDRLTLLVEGLNDEGIARLEPFLHFRTGENGVTMTDGIYKHKATIGNVFIEHRGLREEHSAPSDLRLDFNPNTLEKAGEEVLRALLRRGSYAKVSRVDIAIDVIGDHRMEHLGWHQNGSKAWRLFGQGDRIETWYFGSPQSKRMLRVYDKARKEGETYDWWRIEVQHRPNGGDPLPVNLFDKVRPLGFPSDLDPLNDWTEYAVASAVIRDPMVRFACPSSTRQRWLDRLEIAGREVIEPDRVYRKNREPLLSVVEHWQGLTRDTAKALQKV